MHAMPSVLSLSLVTVLLLASEVMSQQGNGRGPGGGDPTFVADRELFQFLLQHRDDIRRVVTLTDNGVTTLTESDQPDIATAIHRHVASMEARVKEKRPIHRRDPLFAELFRHADQITFVIERTNKGMRVTEAANDPYVVKLIQSHAKVVSLFIKHGFAEVHRNHELPAKP
jgi:hypothetical protein